MEVKYRRVFETLRSEILRGKYSSNSVFPSVAMLIRRFGISNLTAVKVMSKLKEEGLVCSYQGRGTFVTRRGMSRLIGLVVPGISHSSEFFQPIVAELIRKAQEFDYTLLMDGTWSSDASDNGREAIEVAAHFIRRKVAGVIYQPVENFKDSESVNRRVLSAFSKAGIPVVLLDGDIVPMPSRSEYDLVSIDNVGAGEFLAAHLQECGARQIRFLMRGSAGHNVENRVKGVVNAVRGKGGTWRPSNVLKIDPSDREAVRKMLRQRPRPDAFICENDVLAAKLMKTLIALGFSVPGDFLLAGFDDIQIARLSMPGITTIHQPCDVIAATAFSRLVERISKPKLPALHLMAPHSLVVRGSTVANRRVAGIAQGKKKGRK